MEANSIIVSGIQKYKDKNKCVGYKNVTLGSEVHLMKRRIFSNGKHLHWRSPLLANTTDGLFAIVSYKNELLASNPGLIIIDGSNQELLKDNVNDNTEYKPSGIVVLCMAKLEREKISSQYSWESKDNINIKKWKSNIITGHSTHFGSTGNYYLFGSRANYGLIDKSSLRKFVQKKLKKKTKTNIAKLNAQLFE